MKINLLELVGILGGWTVIISAIIYFLFQKISERININWQEKSNLKLEKVKNQLSSKNQLINNLLNFQNSNFNLSHEKRLIAIGEIWGNINYSKKKIPSSLSFIFNILTENEIENLLTTTPPNDQVQFIVDDLYKFDKYEYFNDPHYNSDKIDIIRPFAGEELWLSFETYKAFLGRLAYKIHDDIKINNKLTHWHNDSSIMLILKNYLTDNELNYIIENKMNSLKLVINLLDSKILFQMNNIISGSLATENALSRAIKLQKLTT